MFREDGTQIVLDEISQRGYVPENFVQYFDLSGQVKFRNSKTNEIFTVILAAWDAVEKVAREFGIKPVYHY